MLCSHFNINYLITALSPTYSNYDLQRQVTALETKAEVLEAELNRHKKGEKRNFNFQPGKMMDVLVLYP